MKKKEKGFTLMELLVVVAIIGILAAIVIVSLNRARNKGKDAAIKAQMGQLRSAAEMFNEENGSYTGWCASPEYTRIQLGITNAGATLDTGDVAACDEAADGATWAEEMMLTSASHWCVDSNGVSKEADKGNTDTTCP